MSVTATKDVLVVHFNRFTQACAPNGKYRWVKNSRAVDVPAVLSLGDDRYELRGIVEHLGQSVERGHYVAHVHREGEWFRCSDTHVSSERSPAGAEAYLAMFERAAGSESNTSKRRSVL